MQEYDRKQNIFFNYINIKFLLYVLITIFVLMFCVFYLKLPWHWWFEDDASLVKNFYNVDNLLNFFIDKKTITGYGAGKALVPFSCLSHSINSKLSNLSPTAAYWQNIFVYLLTSFFLFFTLSRLTKKYFASFLCTILWTLLPSSVSTISYIATRHYIEGLPFVCLVIVLTQKVCEENIKKNNSTLVYIIFFTLIAMLYKEYNVTVLPTFLFLYSVFKKKYKIAAIAVGISLFYLVYRLWAIGWVTDYGGITPLTLKEYPTFFYRLPYTLTVSSGGYFIYLIILSVIILSIWRNKKNIFSVIFFVVIILTCLLAICMVSRPIMHSYMHPGTWYRAVFMLNTILLFFTAYLGIKNCNKYLLSAFFIISLILILPGTNKTKTTWDKMKNLEEKEGKFYIANPDKLLISQANASWSIPGVHTMYGVKTPHYIWAGDIYKSDHSETLLKYDSIWLYHNGQIVNAAGLKENLLKYYKEKFKTKP